jgi:hypothetical protein
MALQNIFDWTVGRQKARLLEQTEAALSLQHIRGICDIFRLLKPDPT